MGQVKVLSFGDVKGDFATLAKRIAAYNAKVGPFEVVFCVGEFFSQDHVVNEAFLSGASLVSSGHAVTVARWVTVGGTSAPCVPVYVVGLGDDETSKYYPEESAEIAENITYLGARGSLNLACGSSLA